MTNLKCKRCGREIYDSESTDEYCFDCGEIIDLENSADKIEERDDNI